MRKRFSFALLFLLSVSFACGQEKKGELELLDFPMFIDGGRWIHVAPKRNNVNLPIPDSRIRDHATPARHLRP